MRLALRLRHSFNHVSQFDQGLFHLLRPGVCIVQPQAVSILPAGREDRAGGNADAMRQCRSMQFQRIHISGQLDPEDLSALRTRDPGAVREIARDGGALG